MKKSLFILCTVLLLALLAACGNNSSAEIVSEGETRTSNNQDIQTELAVPANSTEQNTLQADDTAQSEKIEGGNNMLVAYFSLDGEQYGVGVVEEGNTSIIARMIAEQTGADLFEIKPETPYPTTYQGLLDVSRQEMADNSRLKIADTVDNIDNYDTLFIGYPNWWGDMPMIVYNFLESYDLSGKTIVPFCTHGGSGLSNTESTIADITGGKMKAGFAIPGTNAQNDRDAARSQVTGWLREDGFIE